MADPSADERIAGPSSPATALILFQPEAEGLKERVSYNVEAWHVLSAVNPSVDLPSLCSRWKGLFDERLAQPMESEDRGEPGAGFIDLFESGRRWYGIRAAHLLDHPSSPQKQPKQGGRYLFLLERICPDAVNLCMISRCWNLNPREQDIVRLLLSDRSNKEIASSFGLSLNTVKGYVKLLMRRLGASSRTGVISRLLTGRNPSSQPPQ